MKKIMIPTTYKPYEMPDYKEYDVPNKVVEYIEHLEKQEKQTIKDLQEELKKLKIDYSMVVTECKKLKDRIDKAIEYMRNKSVIVKVGKRDFALNLYLKETEYNDLLKILKGE